jgi:hypothetical protein
MDLLPKPGIEQGLDSNYQLVALRSRFYSLVFTFSRAANTA